jgi:hypothetical protein
MFHNAIDSIVNTIDASMGGALFHDTPFYTTFMKDLYEGFQLQSSISFRDVPEILFPNLFDLVIEIPLLSSTSIIAAHRDTFESLVNYYSDQAFQCCRIMREGINRFIAPLFRGDQNMILEERGETGGNQQQQQQEEEEEEGEGGWWPFITTHQLLCLSHTRNAVEMLPNLLSLSLTI